MKAKEIRDLSTQEELKREDPGSESRIVQPAVSARYEPVRQSVSIENRKKGHCESQRPY